MVDDDVISHFKRKFKKYDVSKPSICNGLDKCIVHGKNTSLPLETELADNASETGSETNTSP
jgi:hypothetical protein